MSIRGFSLAFALAMSSSLGIAGAFASETQPSAEWTRQFSEFKSTFAAARFDAGVLWIGQGSSLIAQSALGGARLDSRFDLASLTKGLATALAIHHLVDSGKLGIDDAVAKSIPEWAANPALAKIKIRDLLLHQSGLPAAPTAAQCAGAKVDFRKALLFPKASFAPGARFQYSDYNYIVLALVVEAVSGKSLAEYVDQAIYRRLGLRDTSFQPNPSILTSPKQKEFPHDPCAQALAPRAVGHAGLFSTAGEIAKILQLLLRHGVAENGKTILSAGAVELLTHAQPPLRQRSFGFDVDSAYAVPVRGDFAAGSGFGHTGYTGTSVWVDPASGKFVILLTNRVYGGDTAETQKAIRDLRIRAANLAFTY